MSREAREGFTAFTAVWLAGVVIIVTIMGLVKLGGRLFDLDPTPTKARYNLEQCWNRGGVPVMDTHGDSNDFVTCKGVK